MESIKEKFRKSDKVIDTVKMPEEECDLVYVREDGIGIKANGEKHHIPWETAVNRYVPIRVWKREH